MKIKIEVCEICRKERCDGKVYKIKKIVSGRYNKLRLCKTNPCVVKVNNELYFRYIMGHGIESNWILEEVK